MDWAAVYRSTYAELVRFLYRKVWDVDRARDLAQETFLRALDHEPESPRRWLFTVATNLARDEARGAVRRKRHLALLKAEAETASPPPDPLRRVERLEREAAARRALESLAQRDREILLLWHAGLSYRDIAAETGLAVGAIGTTLARARRRLAEAYHALEAKHVAR
ncbi:MAG TPA: sigma-70 family RNA polymerase sigma factor [Longimicrobiales bacterium]